ncbi:alpha/beta hydrolase-fold protein [Tomitella gaofuii]|uniref:alpha/beta hydrolase-fold protein n=1 Tax=Tomitella gaofuii TaxID=2760083 RepID=UPI0015FDE901|nr:alpha/beta hydrolase-fold protein [Tomitella gaofuii]
MRSDTSWNRGEAHAGRPRAGLRRRLVAWGAVPLAVALALPVAGQVLPQAVPVAHAAPAGEAVPAGVKVTKVQWLSARRVAIWVHSPAMNEDIQVQILVGRDWHIAPDKDYPELLMLDGLRARDDQSGWTIETDIVDFFADKNVNVVLPVGGQSSFYTDWEKPDNGKNYQWETFLTEELPPILHNDWRTSTDKAAIAGLSMGGTAAMMLAERHPDMFDFVASYSGILSTTSLGMPQAIQFAMLDAGGFHSQNMWGLPSDPRWTEQDPLLHVDKLKGMSIYVSSGNGFAGPYDQQSGIPGISTNIAGMGLEILSRMTSQNFAAELNKKGIPANVVYRPSGTHSWPYWQFEMHQSWPQIAKALDVDPDAPDCRATGAIGDLANGVPWLGRCVTPEYDVPGGRAQDFAAGRVFWSAGTGAKIVAGAIGGRYQQVGGPGGDLGLPVSNELATPDGHGRYNAFQNGSIYWMPQTGAHMVKGAVLDKWGSLGWEAGVLGYPTSDPRPMDGASGTVQDFQVGSIYVTDKGAYEVQGAIRDKYNTMGAEGGAMGVPTSDETTTPNGIGKYNRFDKGIVYWTAGTGAWSIQYGPIFDAWEQQGFENGPLGFPTGDQRAVPGGVAQDFEHGTITVADGKTEVAQK